MNNYIEFYSCGTGETYKGNVKPVFQWRRLLGKRPTKFKFIDGPNKGFVFVVYGLQEE